MSLLTWAAGVLGGLIVLGLVLAALITLWCDLHSAWEGGMMRSGRMAQLGVGLLVGLVMGTGARALTQVPTPPVGTEAVAAQNPAPVGPAEPSVPTLAEVDALLLDKLLLVDENLQLRVAALQEEIRRNRAEIQTHLRRLEQAGYTLTRDQAGTWRYETAPAKKETP